MSEERTLRDYQETGVQKYLQCDGAFFAMQMRLGKTLACIRWLKRSPSKPKTILVVAPKTVLLAWEDELEKEGLPQINLVQFTLKERKLVMQDPNEEGFYLCNYETISNLDVKTKEWKILANFDAVILDESICIKNPGSKATVNLLKAAPLIKMRSCLSGLVNPESWLEVWPQVAFANGGDWMGFDNFYKWREAYFQNFGFDWELSNKSRAAIQKAFHEDVHSVTRKQANIRDVKIRQKRIGHMPPEAKRIYDLVEAKWELPGEVNTVDAEQIIDEDPDQAKFKLVVISWLRRIVGGVLPTKPIQIIPGWKCAELVHIAEEELPTDSIVVWFAFNAEIALAYAALIKAGVTCSWINGATSQEDRRERIHGFQSGKYRLMLVQQKCGQYGIDLSKADTAIYYSCDYSYNLRAQSEERIFKVGKPNDLLIIDFITADSIDEAVEETIKDKKSDAGLLLARLMPKSSLTTVH
jgi:hypothetical protein